MQVDDFLSRLTKARKTGPQSWIACCPAHDDRSPSLTVGMGHNGGLIVHCFAGCDVSNVVAAVGLTLSDLMPDERPVEHRSGPVRIPAKDVLEAMSTNALIVALAASDLSQGKPLTDEDRAKLFEISGEFREAIEYATGHKLNIKGGKYAVG